ncbi:MAG TPA: GntR family transcriptional regulator [Steroidobacteraceae bacterium]|nr:GntR family transcriptional regulator [Steroidobacteraceae bacterium]
MDFKPNYPIYLQVADFICEKVLKGEWRNGDKLPALKDLAITTSVNPNTVIKALGFLVDHNILSTQRGVGYFMTDNARAITLELKRKQFIDEVLPDVFASMDLLGLGLYDLTKIYEERRPASLGAPAGSST